MKKYFALLGIILIVLAGCNDDEEEVAQISFSYPNLATLIGEKGSYIKQASPGTFYQYVERVDYTYYTFIFDEITVLGTLAITYHFVEDACDDVIMYTESDELAKAQELMSIAKDELGEAGIYVLQYVFDSTLYEISFATYSSLWAYITDNSYTVDDIYQLYSEHMYDDYSIYAGGFWDGGEFWPFAEIAANTLKSTKAELPFNAWKGKMERRKFVRW
jgi:hypothetical protein